MHNTSSPLLAQALSLASLGYLVFPLQPGRKIPLGGSNGCLDGTTDADRIREWWGTNPRANIGLHTSGLMVIDVDPEGFEWLASPPGEIPECPRARTPRGGVHLVMRQPIDREWTIGSNQIAPGVDHRGNRGYIVVAPSIVNNVAYAWEAPLVAREHLPEVPAWLIARLDEIHGQSVLSLLSETGSGPTSQEIPEPKAHLEPVRSGVIPRGQRHRALVKMAGHARHVGHTEGEILALVSAVARERCDPPVPAYELAKLARSVAKYAPDQVATIRVECLYEESFGRPDPFGRSEIRERAAETIARPVPFPAHLLDVPGFVGDVMRWNLATAPTPQPVFALAGALALQAVLAACKVRDERGNRTNLYIVCTGYSGTGKGHPQKITENALMAAGADALLGSGEIASDAGLARMVEQQRNILIQIDEFGRTLKGMLDERANHLVGISTALLKLWSSADSIWLGKVYSNREQNIRVAYPCVSMIGYTVPENFYAALTPDSLSDGLLARLLLLEGDPDARSQESAPVPPPDIVMEAIRWWVNYAPSGNLSGGLTPSSPCPALVPTAPEARERFRALQNLVDEQPRKDEDGGSIWARAVEQSMRLALVYACSDQRRSPVVTAAAASWACDLVEHRSWRVLELARDWLAASDFDRVQKRILRAVKASGSASKTEVCRALRDVPKRQRDDALASMIESGTICLETEETNGRTRMVYREPI